MAYRMLAFTEKKKRSPIKKTSQQKWKFQYQDEGQKYRESYFSLQTKINIYNLRSILLAYGTLLRLLTQRFAKELLVLAKSESENVKNTRNAQILWNMFLVEGIKLPL